MKFKVGDRVLLTRDNKTIKGVVVFVDQGSWTALPYLVEVARLDCVNYDDYNVLKWSPTAIWTYEGALKLDEATQNVFDVFDFNEVYQAFIHIIEYRVDLVEELVRTYEDTNSPSTSIFDMIAGELEDEIGTVAEALARLVELQKEEN